MNRYDRILVAGHTGMLGSALVRTLRNAGYVNILTAGRQEADLRDPASVKQLFADLRPDHVLLAAARVGGIKANTQYPADFMYDNLMIQCNVIQQSRASSVSTLMMIGSSCMYPRECPQPMTEDSLMTGPLEPTNEGYALAKIAGLRLAEYYHRQYGMRCLNPIPCNLYGTNDSFDPDDSHVLSALVRKFVDAAEDGAGEVVLWGTGSARREFMHVDDCARALVFLADGYGSPEPVNVGWGTDISICDLATLVADCAGYRGELTWDSAMPDGMPRKCLDVSKLTSLGFRPLITLERGIDMAIAEYRRLKGSGALS